VSEQRCGTCRWWELGEGMETSGRCHAPIPASVVGNVYGMIANDGTNCPCCQRKESDEHNSQGTD